MNGVKLLVKCTLMGCQNITWNRPNHIDYKYNIIMRYAIVGRPYCLRRKGYELAPMRSGEPDLTMLRNRSQALYCTSCART